MKNIFLLVILTGGFLYGLSLHSGHEVAQTTKVKVLSATLGPQETQPITQKEIYELVDKTFSMENTRVRWEAQTIAKCESNWHHGSKNSNSSASGVYQFLQGTWISTRKRMGRNPDPLLRFNPVENIETAHFLWLADGKSWREWVCSKEL